MTTDHIIPTKKSPVFAAVCTDFGTIETGRLYKMWNVEKEFGYTYDITFMDSVNRLHEWIKENRAYVNELPGKIAFRIDAIDGSLDEYGCANRTTVYTITAAKAKKYLLS